jgi:uncharacterized protein (DUF2147 family)
VKRLHRNFARLCLAGLAVGVAYGQARADAPGGTPLPTGTWLDESGRAGITIAPCGEKLCGTITWLKAPLDAQGKPKLDVHNTDAALQTRPICGLPILGGFVAGDSATAWTGGFIYDPTKGESYKSNMHLQPDGTLVVRGYIGIPWLGRSQVWTRPATPLPHC